MNSLEQGFQLASLRILPAENIVLDGQRRIELEPRVMRLLVLLARHQGEVLGRDQLIEQIWGDVLVQEDSLTKAISELRRILGDDPRSPQFVRTIRKGGYQLIADIRALPSAPKAAVNRPLIWISIAIVAVVILSFVVFRPGSNALTEDAAALKGLTITRVTSYAGQETEPHLSPDGQQIVFVRHHDEIRHDLFVKSLGLPFTLN